jgi:hypothetical protein
MVYLLFREAFYFLRNREKAEISSPVYVVHSHQARQFGSWDHMNVWTDTTFCLGLFRAFYNISASFYFSIYILV